MGWLTLFKKKKKNGVCQGCVLSPLLFKHILKNENLIDREQDDIAQLNKSLNELLFADDQSLFYEDEEQL